jgi:hypothetical protein
MSQELVPLPKAQGLTPARGDALTHPPAVISAAGERARKRFREFFTANIQNENTRLAYLLAAERFFEWCRQLGIGLERVEPALVAAYREQLLRDGYSKPSVKQHLAALRMLRAAKLALRPIQRSIRIS